MRARERHRGSRAAAGPSPWSPVPAVRRAARTIPVVAALLSGCARAREAPRAAPSDTVLAVNGTRLFVHREGSGEAVVVVHGGPVLDHGYLVEPLRPLADDHALVWFDQRLSGRSAGTVDSASVRLESFAEDIEAIRQALGLGRIHLLAHSWGGLLALKYATLHGDRLRSMVLVSPNPPTTALWQAEQRAEAEALEPADTAGMGAIRASEAFRAGDPEAIEALLRLSFRGQLEDPALAERLRFHIEPDYGERSRQFGFLMGDLMAYDLTEPLSRVRVPTLIVYGAGEVGSGIGGPALRDAIPGARLETIPDAVHFSFLERPDAFLALVRPFLEQAETRSGPGP
jgi:proline iminopeptidase